MARQVPGGERQELGRRAMIAGTAAGVAALAVGGLATPPRSRAANGGNVILGQNNEATAITRVSRPNFNTSANLAGNDFGLIGDSKIAGGQGVVGTIQANNGVGVLGRTLGHHSQVAVDGDATQLNGQGYGVRGRTKTGIGVYAEATGGFALQVVGRAVFSRSGKTTIAAAKNNKTIAGTTHGMSASTVVVATVQGNPAGVWVRNVSVNVAANSFTIRLNKAAPAGGVTVGYFIVN